MAAISKEEYLKRYLSKETSKDKKKKKKVKGAKQSNMRIIDDDVDIKMLPSATRHVDEDPEDEEPTVADVVDDRPQHVQRLEAYRRDQRWKVIGKDKEEKDETATQDYGVITTGTGRRQRYDSDSSASPPGRKRHDSDSDTGRSQPARKGRHDSDSDPSPVRRRRHDSDSDTNTCHRTQVQTASPGPKRGSQRRSKSPAGDSKAGRKRHDSDSDQSPARGRPGHDSDHSPPRKQRHNDSASDQSPPRKQTKQADTDQSPPRRQRRDSGSDQSPPRKGRQDNDSDQSPPRKRKGDRGADPSPPRKSKGGNKPDQPAPRRRRWDSPPDQSPPRKRRADRDEDLSPPRLSRKGENSAKPEKTLGGTKAGLSSAAEMKREAEKMKRKEAAVFSKIDKEALGQEAKTVFRDKSGKRRNLAEEQIVEEEEAKKKAVEDKKYEEWGKGLKQKELREQVLEEMVHEASKPLARYKDDQDLDRILRDTEREGDPMAKFLKKKKTKKDDANEKPRYRGPAPPPNRFGIMPGYRWDGVDRSNGFEKQIFTKMSDQKAVKEHAYKWSTEDM